MVLRNLTFLNKAIQTIRIQENQFLNTIEADAFLGVVGLRYLFLDNNDIHMNGILHYDLHIPNLFVPFRTLETLEKLNLSYNDIQNYDLSTYPVTSVQAIPEILPCMKELD